MRLKHFVSVLMMLLAMSIGNVWADNVTYTWNLANGDLGANGNPATSVTKGSPEITWSTDFTWGGSTKYLGNDNNKGVQIGAATKSSVVKNCTSLVLSTSGITGTITNITVNGCHASSGGASIIIKVGGTTVKSSTNFTTTNDNYSTGNITATGGIEITISNSAEKAFYLKSISVSYTTGGQQQQTPSLSWNPTSWNFETVTTTASASKTFSLTGSNLTAGTLTISAPSGYSVDPTSVNVSAGTLSSTNVTVTKNTTTAGTYNGNLSVYGGGVTEANKVNAALTMVVAPPVAVTSVSVKESTSIEVGATETLSATVGPDNASDKAVTWSSDDETFATVDQNGKVTGVAIGSTTIKATAHDGSGVYGSCTVTVTAAKPKIIIDGVPLTGTATTEASTKKYGNADEDSIDVVLSNGAKQQAVPANTSNSFTGTTDGKAILIGKQGTYIYNSTPLPGDMKKFELYANGGASAKVEVSVTFSRFPLTEAAEEGDTLYTALLSTLDHVYDCSTKIPTGARYFYYKVTNAYNSQVQFRITYEPPVKSAVTYSATPAQGSVVVKKGNTAIGNGDELIAEGTILTVEATPNTQNHYIGGTITVKNANNEDVTASVLNGTTLTMPAYAITVTASFTPTFAITANPNIEGGSVSWTDGTTDNVAYAAQGAHITPSAMPDGAHQNPVLSIYTNTDEPTYISLEENQDYFLMPAQPVVISATFENIPCSQLDDATNIEVTGKEYPYDAVTLTWDAVTNADYYVVEIGSGNNINTSDHLTETTFTVPTNWGLDAGTQYEYRIYAYSNTPASYCYSMVNGFFSTEALPVVYMRLSENGHFTTLQGYNLGDKVDELPGATPGVACSGVVFMGWDTDKDCTSAPAYKEGDEYIINTNAARLYADTLYAVYATESPVTTVSTTMNDFIDANNLSVSTTSDKHYYTTLNLDDYLTLSTTGDNDCGSFWGTTTHDWRLYQAKGGDAKVTLSNNNYSLKSVKFTFGNSNNGVLLDGTTALTSGTAVDASGTSKTYTVGNSGNATNGQIRITAVEVKYYTSAPYSGYTTSCINAPEAETDSLQVREGADAVANGLITVTYNDYVNLDDVSVAIFNDANCTESFDGNWLTATQNANHNIAYTLTATNLYVARTAYIKLTARETNNAVDPAVVIIPVTQAAKPAVFESIEELVAADLATNTDVTVTLTDVAIENIYYWPDNTSEENRKGVILNIQKAGQYVKIYYNAQVSTEWVAGGKLSGTLTNCPWKTYSGAWQLAPKFGWAWSELTYTEPATASAVEVTGFDGQTEYIDGQAFNTNGLHARVTYTDQSYDDDPVGVTYEVTPATLTQGQTSVTVVATYNNIPSEEYVVNGLTVTAVPNKTVAQFIAAEGTRCYLEGVVSNYSNKTKGYFNLTDATGTIYIYGCTSPSSFDAGDKVKVLAEVYEYYQTTHEAKNVQYVSKVPAATITIANKIMEEGDEPWTIEATTDPEGAASHLSYSIKAGSDDCITLSEGVVTATAQGTATIIASVQDGDDYMANSVEFTVTVNPAAGHTNVVIYAYYGGHYYALTNAVEALEFTVNNNKIIVHNDAEKDAIIWDHAVRGTEHTFYNAASGKYLKGSTSTTLTASTGATGDHYIWQEYANGAYLTTTATAQTVRTILYRNGYGFKNYDVNNAGASGYANPGITTAEVVVDEQVVRNGLTPGKYGTICLEKNVVSFTGATMYSIDSKASDLSYITLEEETGALEAGRPYIFLATGSEIKVQYGNQTAATAGDYNGLVGSFTREQLAEGMYIIQNNKFYRTGADNYVGAHKAYINMGGVPEEGETAHVPGRRYVTMQIGDVQTPTALDEVTVNQENAKFILNGQLYILRDGKLYNAQGQLVK